MAHFAKIDSQNLITDVLVVANSDIQDLPFPESEPVGVAYLRSMFPDTDWKQTSYNGNFRYRYAGIGYTFYPDVGEYGGFSPPKAYPDFIFDEATCQWIPPVPYPTDGHEYYWDDAAHQWIRVHPSTPVTVIGE